jgi:hypothetical protein
VHCPCEEISLANELVMSFCGWMPWSPYSSHHHIEAYLKLPLLIGFASYANLGLSKMVMSVFLTKVNTISITHITEMQNVNEDN